MPVVSEVGGMEISFTLCEVRDVLKPVSGKTTAMKRRGYEKR